MKLNLGSGKTPIPGYEDVDIKLGKLVYPLSYPDNCAEEIRASHILEHFQHKEVVNVLKEWLRVLEPGGTIYVAVPDFYVIAKKYLEQEEEVEVQGYISGGQEDEYDFHKSCYDEGGLAEALQEAGFQVKVDKDGRPLRWFSQVNDCASLPISLNLMATKPQVQSQTSYPTNTHLIEKPTRVAACMSIPRLTFTGNFFSVFSALMPLGISLRKQSGVYWEQALTRGMRECMEENPEYILTIDYDTIFTKNNVIDLINLANRHKCDAISALQVGRGMGPLFMMNKEDVEFETINEQKKALVPVDMLEKDILPVLTMHFGLTLIRVSSLMKLKKPWFSSFAGKDGDWGKDRMDPDISFWHNWKDSGLKAYTAPHIVVGHAEMTYLWPDQKMNTIHQTEKDYWNDGIPGDVWK